MVLFSALTGVMIGSLGTVVIFWLCGALERKTVIEKVSPELRDATIQAEYTQATSDETSDFRQMHRAQTSSSYHLYIGTAERCYHLDRRCRCYPDWDNVKRGLTICEICRISSSTFEIGQCISPTAECFGVFSHSKGFGADRSSSKTHSPKVPRFQVKVPK